MLQHSDKCHINTDDTNSGLRFVYCGAVLSILFYSDVFFLHKLESFTDIDSTCKTCKIHSENISDKERMIWGVIP